MERKLFQCPKSRVCICTVYLKCNEISILWTDTRLTVKLTLSVFYFTASLFCTLREEPVWMKWPVHSFNAHFFSVRLNTQAFHTFNYSVANINEAPNLFRYYSCPSFNSGCQPFGFPSSRSMLRATLHRLIFSSLTRGESAALCHSLNRPRVSLPPHWTGASVGGFSWARVILINIVRGSFMSFTCTSREILLWSLH